MEIKNSLYSVLGVFVVLVVTNVIADSFINDRMSCRFNSNTMKCAGNCSFSGVSCQQHTVLPAKGIYSKTNSYHNLLNYFSKSKNSPFNHR